MRVVVIGRNGIEQHLVVGDVGEFARDVVPGDDPLIDAAVGIEACVVDHLQGAVEAGIHNIELRVIARRLARRQFNRQRAGGADVQVMYVTSGRTFHRVLDEDQGAAALDIQSAVVLAVGVEQAVEDGDPIRDVDGVVFGQLDVAEDVAVAGLAVEGFLHVVRHQVVRRDDGLAGAARSATGEVDFNRVRLSTVGAVDRLEAAGVDGIAAVDVLTVAKRCAERLDRQERTVCNLARINDAAIVLDDGVAKDASGCDDRCALGLIGTDRDRGCLGIGTLGKGTDDAGVRQAGIVALRAHLHHAEGLGVASGRVDIGRGADQAVVDDGAFKPARTLVGKVAVAGIPCTRRKCFTGEAIRIGVGDDRPALRVGDIQCQDGVAVGGVVGADIVAEGFGLGVYVEFGGCMGRGGRRDGTAVVQHGIRSDEAGDILLEAGGRGMRLAHVEAACGSNGMRRDQA